MDNIKDQIQEEEEEHMVIGGDFNARTRNEGGPIREDEGKARITRKSKDKVVNRKGRILINKIEERGWMILNGSFNKEGGWTYIGEVGASIVDYVIANDKAEEMIEKVGEGDRTESDHIPLEVELEGPDIQIERKTDRKVVEKNDWEEEGREKYRKCCEGWTCEQKENEKIWQELKLKVKSSITKCKKKIGIWKLGNREWHSKEWKREKRYLRTMLRKMKKGKISREDYVKKRKDYKIWCKEEKRRHEEEEERKIRSIRTEKEAWKYINKYRKKRVGIDKEIDLGTWKKHFMELLGGKEERIVRQIKNREDELEEGEEEAQDISQEELVKQWKKLKMGKAPGEDGIENEAWKYMTTEIGDVLGRLLNSVWKNGKIPEDWKEGIISLIFKKGEKSEVGNYRGVTLMNTAYKMYASILNDKLMREVKEKLQESQFGFREGRGAIDAIYGLNYIVNKELGRKEEKIFAFFADLKAAFDRVDRQELNRRMESIGIEDQLRKRVMEMYRETKSKVRVGERGFLDGKRSSTGMPAEPNFI